jgi:3-deoxy-manno-octulosonate cytidylyltransferase (CMP-KDO synthetase)
MKVLGVIPARYGSTRFPGKPLAMIKGKPMIEHVYRRCLKARMLDSVIVATDDGRIYNCVRNFGGRVMMTSPKHRSGSDRIAEIIQRPGYRGFGIIINIQGDEPLIDPKAIDLLAKGMVSDAKLRMATLAGSFRNSKDLRNPNTVKVACDAEKMALYFSRSVIPFDRGRKAGLKAYLKHIGIYAYRRQTLLDFIHWSQSKLERTEKLEQLRALENGVRIKVIKTTYLPVAVDTPGDLRNLA